MASVAPTTHPDMVTVLNALASCAQFPINNKIFAESEGIARADNAVAKLKRVLKTHGYKLEDKKVSRIDEDGTGFKSAPKTLKKAATTKEAKAKTTPTPKKRKLENDETTAEKNDVDAGASGKVQNEVTDIGNH